MSMRRSSMRAATRAINAAASNSGKTRAWSVSLITTMQPASWITSPMGGMAFGLMKGFEPQNSDSSLQQESGTCNRAGPSI